MVRNPWSLQVKLAGVLVLGFLLASCASSAGGEEDGADAVGQGDAVGGGGGVDVAEDVGVPRTLQSDAGQAGEGDTAQVADASPGADAAGAPDGDALLAPSDAGGGSDGGAAVDAASDAGSPEDVGPADGGEASGDAGGGAAVAQAACKNLFVCVTGCDAEQKACEAGGNQTPQACADAAAACHAKCQEDYADGIDLFSAWYQCLVGACGEQPKPPAPQWDACIKDAMSPGGVCEDPTAQCLAGDATCSDIIQCFQAMCATIENEADRDKCFLACYLDASLQAQADFSALADCLDGACADVCPPAMPGACKGCAAAHCAAECSGNPGSDACQACLGDKCAQPCACPLCQAQAPQQACAMELGACLGQP